MYRSKDEIISLLKNIDIQESDFNYNEKKIFEEYDPKNQVETSLPIKLLSIFGGILATISFSGALFIAGVYKSASTMATLGLILIAIGIFINTQKKVILDTISICAYILGLVLLGFGMVEIFGIKENINSICITFVIIGLITLYLNQTYILAFFAVLLIVSSLFNVGSEFFRMGNVLMVILSIVLFLLMTYEAKVITSFKRFTKLYDPVRIGIIISMMAHLFWNGNYFSKNNNEVLWLLSITNIVLLMYTVKYIIKKMNLSQTKKATEIYIMALLIFCSCFLAPYILTSLLILLLSYKVAYRTGFVIGIVAVLYFVIRFYYDLDFDLLTKSIIMITTGILFLLFYWIYKKAIVK